MELKVQSIKIKDSNHLAQILTEMEGGKVNLTIAQVKEVISKLSILQSYNYDAVHKVLHKTALVHKKARKKKSA